MTSNFIDLICYDSETGGHIFASCAPGKFDPKKGIARDLIRDIDLIKKQNITVIVSLIEDFEFEELLIQKFPDLSLDNNIQFIHYPIVDHQIPNDIKSFHKLILYLCHLLENGHRILIHCRGGVGRTGTVCACILLHFGYSASEAIYTVKDRRQRALRNQKQCKFIHYYEKMYIN